MKTERDVMRELVRQCRQAFEENFWQAFEGSMPSFRKFGDPFVMPGSFDYVNPELQAMNAEFSDQIYKAMSDQVMQSMASQFGMPAPLFAADCSNYASAASQTITPNPALPPKPMSFMERVQGYSGLRTDVSFKPCKWMTRSETRKRPCTNRRQLWRKWHATKTVQVPDPSVYCIGGQWCGHPETLRKLATALEALDKSQTKIGPLEGICISVETKCPDNVLLTVETSTDP